jgi:hypothetical protein
MLPVHAARIWMHVSMSDVISRSEAAKQSILSFLGEMDCFASLAMAAKLFENGIKFTSSRTSGRKRTRIRAS